MPVRRLFIPRSNLSKLHLQGDQGGMRCRSLDTPFYEFLNSIYPKGNQGIGRFAPTVSSSSSGTRASGTFRTCPEKSTPRDSSYTFDSVNTSSVRFPVLHTCLVLQASPSFYATSPEMTMPHNSLEDTSIFSKESSTELSNDVDLSVNKLNETLCMLS